jgi:uncharacterized protein YjlB
MPPATSIEQFIFEDAGHIPNSALPLVVYRGVRSGSGERLAVWFEEIFSRNHWPAAWRYTVYNFTHYHSTCHEVMGIYQGNATLRLGNSTGVTLEVNPGDALVIPAGVSHRRLESSPDFCAVGAYPRGQQPDILRGRPDDRPTADENIARVSLPTADPVYGPFEGLVEIWENASTRPRQEIPSLAGRDLAACSLNIKLSR